MPKHTRPMNMGAWDLCVIITWILIKGITGQDSVVVELLSQVTCSNTSVETVNQACLDVYNIPIQIPSPPTLAEATPEDALLIIENFIVDESDTLCRNQENYTKAVACLYYVNKKCNSVSAQDNGIYPAESDFQQQMTQSCDAIASITGGDNHAVEVTATCTLNTVGTTIAQLSQQCMSLNSVQEQLSDAASLSGAASADIVMDYVNLLIQKDSKTMCSSTDATLKATTCLYAVIYKCRFGGSFIKTVPTQNETRMGLAATCSIVESIVTVTPEIEALTTNLLCSNQTAVLAAQQQCLSMHNLPLNIQNPQSLATGDHNAVIAANTLLISNTVLVCQNTEAYSKVVRCLQYIIYSCDDNRSIPIAAYSTSDNSQQLNATCSFLSSSPVACVYSLFTQLNECSRQAVQEFGGSETDTCLMQAKTDACSYPLLRLCGDAAVRIYEDQTRNDTGCKNEPDTTVELSNGHTHRVDCSTTKGIQDGALDCLLYHGIYLEVPQLSSPEETTDYILKGLTVSRYRDMCSNMSAFHNAVSCTLAVLTRCSPSMRHLFADPHSTTLGMTSFCEHKHFDKFASSCVMNADQSTCEKRMVNSSTPEQICSIIQTFTDCMKASVESCGPSTAELYTHLLSSQVPAPCVQGVRTTTPVPKSRAGKRVASMLMTVLALIYSRVGVSQG